MAQPALVTGSISSAIGMGGGTSPSTQLSGGAPFTGGFQFSDPQLQLSWADPLRREEYDPFSYTMPEAEVPGNETMQGLPALEGYWAYNGRPLVDIGSDVAYGELLNDGTRGSKQFAREPRTWNLSQGGIDPSWIEARKNVELVAGGYGRPGAGSALTKSGTGVRGLLPDGMEPFSDARQLRALRALENPNDRNVSYFDLRAHPDYGGISRTWYVNADDPSSYASYGLHGVYDRMQQLGQQYGTDSQAYLNPDFFARHVFLNRPGDVLYGPVQNAYDIGSMWAQQPAFGGTVDWGQVAPWATREAAQGERARLQKLWEDDMKDSANFGRGVLTAVGLGLSLMGAPWQVGALWSLGTSGGSPGSLLSLAGPLVSQLSGVGNAVAAGTGAGDYGLSSSASWLDYLDANSALGTAAGHTPASISDIWNNAAPMSTTQNWLNTLSTTVPGVQDPFDVRGGSLDTPQSGQQNPTQQRMINQAIKSVGKAAGGQARDSGDAEDRLAAMKKWSEQKPQLQRMQGMQVAPMSEPAAPEAEERWRRLRGQTVIPGTVMTGP